MIIEIKEIKGIKIKIPDFWKIIALVITILMVLKKFGYL
jgi:hypothetical protein